MDCYEERKKRLFFIDRLPNWRGKDENWKKPDKDEAYSKMIFCENFIIKEDIISCHNAKLIEDDIEKLKKFLLEDFFKANTEAIYHQNEYFRQQWNIVIATFFSALIVTSAIILGAYPFYAQYNLGLLTTILTTFVTLITAGISIWVQQQKSQYEWYRHRTIAESLRRQYFLFLAHVFPYNIISSTDVLEQNIQLIKNPKTQVRKVILNEAPRPSHDLDDVQKLIELYSKKRVEPQIKFYESQAKEYKRNLDFVVLAGAILVSCTGLITLINTYLNSPALFLLIGLLPVMGALLISFDRIYGWERKEALYTDAKANLEQDKIIPLHDTEAQHSHLEQFVKAVETTLEIEMSQWGQSVLSDAANTSRLSAKEVFEQALQGTSLSDADKERVRDILNR